MTEGWEERITYYRVDPGRVVRALKEYFKGRREVLIVVLYGSALREGLVRDIDVAVLARGMGLLSILLMGAELEEILGAPVDLVPLESMPPRVRLEALARGEPVLVRDWRVYYDLVKMSIEEIEGLGIHLRRSLRVYRTRAPPVRGLLEGAVGREVARGDREGGAPGTAEAGACRGEPCSPRHKEGGEGAED